MHTDRCRDDQALHTNYLQSVFWLVCVVSVVIIASADGLPPVSCLVDSPVARICRPHSTIWPHSHYNDVIMSTMASQITSLTIVYSTAYSGVTVRSKKTSKLRVTGLCAGNSPVTGEFPAQRASNAENVSIWWHHHALGHRPPADAVITAYTLSFRCEDHSRPIQRRAMTAHC